VEVIGAEVEWLVRAGLCVWGHRIP
jgi:hypothetical protein